MPKKRIIDKMDEVEIEEIESKVEEPEIEKVVVKPDEKLDKKKKAYIVTAVNKNHAFFRVAPDSCSFTKNIWGDKLVPGDTIYLEE